MFLIQSHRVRLARSLRSFGLASPVLGLQVAWDSPSCINSSVTAGLVCLLLLDSHFTELCFLRLFFQLKFWVYGLDVRMERGKYQLFCELLVFSSCKHEFSFLPGLSCESGWGVAQLWPFAASHPLQPKRWIVCNSSSPSWPFSSWIRILGFFSSFCLHFLWYLIIFLWPSFPRFVLLIFSSWKFCFHS